MTKNSRRTTEIPRRIGFGGKTYTFYASYRKKVSAQKVAKEFRAGGDLARVVPVKNYRYGKYLLYVRRKK